MRRCSLPGFPDTTLADTETPLPPFHSSQVYSKQITSCYFCGRCECNYTPTNPAVCWKLFHARVKGLVRQSVLRLPRLVPASLCTFLQSDGNTSEKPTRIRGDTLCLPLSANLILPPFLPDVLQLGEIDKRPFDSRAEKITVLLPFVSSSVCSAHCLPQSLSWGWTNRHAFNFKMARPGASFSCTERSNLFCSWSTGALFVLGKLQNMFGVWACIQTNHKWMEHECTNKQLTNKARAVRVTICLFTDHTNTNMVN